MSYYPQQFVSPQRGITQSYFLPPQSQFRQPIQGYSQVKPQNIYIQPQYIPPRQVYYPQNTVQPQIFAQSQLPLSSIQYQQPKFVNNNIPVQFQSPQRSIQQSFIPPQQLVTQQNQQYPFSTTSQSFAPYQQPQRQPQYQPQGQTQKPQQIVQSPQVKQLQQLIPQQQQQLVQSPLPLKQFVPPPQQNQQQQQQKQPIKEQKQLKNQQPTSKDEDLEKKFQDAIDKTRDLVNKYQYQEQNTDQEQPESEQQNQDDNNQLQDLALQYEDGYIYRGQGYEPATREGFGILTDQEENEVYSGFWQANQYHGRGKLINFSAEQLNGAFDYQDLSTIDNGWLQYEGEFSEGKMHGQGILQLTNGEKFEGLFNDGMIDGEGVFSTESGQTINGIWKEGVLQQQL